MTLDELTKIPPAKQSTTLTLDQLKATPVVPTTAPLASRPSDNSFGLSDITPHNVLAGAMKVGKGLISNEVAAGQDIAGAIGGNFMQDKFNAPKLADTNYLYTLLKLKNQAKKEGRDTSHLDQQIKNYKPTIDNSIQDVFPALKKTNLQVAGDFGGVALDVASAGSYGNAAAGSETGKLLTSGVRNAAQAALPAAVQTGEQGLGQTLTNIGKKTATRAGIGGVTGYGYDVTRNAQSGKTGTDILKPGGGTLLGAGIPTAIGAVQAAGAIGRSMAPRIINSLIKPLARDFSYGKNPGRAVAEEGITGNSLDDLSNNINQSRQKTGREIGDIANKLEGKAKVNIAGSLKPIDDAMEEAAAQNNPTLLKRLTNVKAALTDNLSRDTKLPTGATDSFINNAVMQLDYKGEKDLASKLRLLDVSGVTTASGLKQAVEDGLGPEALNNPNISNWFKTIVNNVKEVHPELSTGDVVSLSSRNLDSGSFADAFNLKKQVGDITQWTGNPSDDKIVNKALKEVYGGVKGAMESAAQTVDPSMAGRLRVLNGKYADLTSAEIATKYRDIISQRQAMVSMPLKTGGVAGLLTAIGTGGAAIPTILAGVTVAALDKALGSTAVKTRLASWIGSQSPSAIAKILEQNPAIQTTLYRAFPKIGSLLNK